MDPSNKTAFWPLVGIGVSQSLVVLTASLISRGSIIEAVVGWIMHAPGLVIAGWLSLSGRAMKNAMVFGAIGVGLAFAFAVLAPAGIFDTDPALHMAVSSLAISGFILPVWFLLNGLLLTLLHRIRQ